MIIEDLAPGNTLQLQIPYRSLNPYGGYSTNFSLGLGSLMIQVGDNPEDQIHIESFDLDDVFANPIIDTIEFSDGTVLSYEELLTHGFDLDGTDGDDTLYGTQVDDRLKGFAGNDTITAKEGNDTLDGGLGDDTMYGNEGDDTYIVEQLGDLVIEDVEQGSDTVRTELDNYTVGDNVENLEMLGASITGNGNELNNRVTGNEQDNVLNGFAGNDQLLGLAGADTLNGGAGIDTLSGGEGNDVLDGGTGADSMIGGTGDDVYYKDDNGDVITEMASAGFDRIVSSIDSGMDNHVEALDLIGSEDLSATGNSLGNTITGNDGNNLLDGREGDDVLIGGAGNDYLIGGAGHDSMAGGTGDDTYVVDSIEDLTIEDVGSGVDIVIANFDYTLQANIENLVLAVGSMATSATGNSLDNIITGNNQNNIIDGGQGADTMIGGQGSDTYVVDSTQDQVIEANNEGYHHNDQVLASATYTLTDNVEDLTLTGMVAIDGTGNDLSNKINGNSADNNLTGMAGDDFINGGDGKDVLHGGIGNDVLDGNNGDDIIDGGFDNDHLKGGEGNDTLMGGQGADYLDGEAGADTLLGGSGDDNYRVDNTEDIIIENALEGHDEVRSTVTYTLSEHTEDLELLDSANINGTGNAADNALSGNAGDNVLSGMAGDDTLNGFGGNDTLIGGTGDDTYIISDTNDVIIEQMDEGNDTVKSSVTHSLGENIESLELTGTQHSDGSGNALDNTLLGNDASNELNGYEGNDHLDGASGDDLLYGHEGDDYLYGGDDGDYLPRVGGDDRIAAEYVSSHQKTLYSLATSRQTQITDGEWRPPVYRVTNDDYLDGGAGNDYLDGGSGNDVLYGGEGNDYLYGGDDGGGYGEPPTNPDLFTAKVTIGGDFPGGTNSLPNNDILHGGNGDDVLEGGSGNDFLYGDADSDILRGGTGSDTLDGGTGIDHMEGGEGSDIYYVDGYSETVFVPGDEDEDEDPEPHVCEDVIIDPVPESKHPGNNGNQGGNGGGPKGNEGVGNGEDAPPPGHDENYNDGEGTSPGEPGRKGPKEGNPGLGNKKGQYAETSDAIVFATTVIGSAVALNAEYSTMETEGTTTNGYYQTTWTTDTISEASGAGYDKVYSSVTYHLSDNLEELHLTGLESIDAYGNNLDNALYGNDADNRLEGGLGGDYLAGKLGNDTYVVNSSDDQMIEHEGQGVDTVVASLDWLLDDNLENLTLVGEAIIGQGNGLDNTLLGNDEDNTLYGFIGDDVLGGGKGNDRLQGGVGNDTYLIYRDEGIDVVDDFLGQTTVRFGVGIDAASVVVHTQDVEGMPVAQVRLLDSHGTELAQGFDMEMIGGVLPEVNFEFSDGSTASMSEFVVTTTENILSNTDDILQTGNDNDVIVAGAGNDEISAGAGNDVVTGEDGDDIIRGEGGNDVLDGGTGSDHVLGGWGDDTLTGGANNDVLYGGHGADTYQINAGDGHDIVSEAPCEDISVDKVSFGEDISATNLWFEANGDHLTVSVLGSYDKVTINNWFVQENTIEQFETTEGLILGNVQVQQLIDAMAGYAPTDSGDLTLTSEERQHFDTLIASSWQAKSVG